MHRSSTTGSRLAPRRLVFLTLLGALLVLALAQAVPALAAGPFTGGASEGDYPLYVANDHSVNALRFSASELAASTDYYVKVRISPTNSISGGTSRGFTWNPATQEWVQERDEWSKLPSFTTDATGAYSSGNVWTFFKFGDTTKPTETGSAPGTCSCRCSRWCGGERDDAEQRDLPRRHARRHDRATDVGRPTGFRVHNGTRRRREGQVPSDGNALAAATLRTSTSVIPRTDAAPTGVVEGWRRHAGGRLRLAVPAGLGLRRRRPDTQLWPAWAITGFTGAVADVDIALGAADTTPPSAVDSLASSSREPRSPT